METGKYRATAEFENQYSAAYFNTIQLKSSDSSQKPELLPSRNAHFNILKSDDELEEAKELVTPKNTENNTAWAVKVCKEWSLSLLEVSSWTNKRVASASLLGTT